MPWLTTGAQYLSLMGRHEEAVAAIKRAQVIDPVSLSVGAHVGRILYFASKYDDAIHELQRALELNPNQQPARTYLGWAYLQKGMYKEAIEQATRAIELRDSGVVNYTLAQAYALAGRRDEAQKLLEELVELSRTERQPAAGIALVYTALGERDEAFAWLDRAYDAYDSWLFQLHDPIWDPLRSDPRFQDLLRRMNLPQSTEEDG